MVQHQAEVGRIGGRYRSPYLMVTTIGFSAEPAEGIRRSADGLHVVATGGPGQRRLVLAADGGTEICLEARTELLFARRVVDHDVHGVEPGAHSTRHRCADMLDETHVVVPVPEGELLESDVGLVLWHLGGNILIRHFGTARDEVRVRPVVVPEVAPVRGIDLGVPRAVRLAVGSGRGV